MPKTKKSLSRTDAEQAEGLEAVKNDVPETRLPAKQQIQKTDDAMDAKPKAGTFGLKRTEAKGAELKQTKVAEIISGDSSNAGMGISAMGRGVSGTAGGVLGADSSTPIAGTARSGSRTGKKFDRIATKLNFTPSEQALVVFDESKPLAEAGSLDQGFNGTYRNELGRSQKKMGAVPGDLMFQRSVDLILKDQLYFTEGQIVRQSTGDETVSISIDEKGERPYSLPVGNYVHRSLKVGFQSDGSVRYMGFEVDDVTPPIVQPEVANATSSHRLTHLNSAELDRINMDVKAGDEKAEIWSPIPRAVRQPTKLVYTLKAIEAQTGAYPYLAYSKAMLNMSWQLNRAAKDGQDIITPAIEQVIGSIKDYDDSSIYRATYTTLHDCLITELYQAGSPGLMLAAYDSIGKYNNKADLLLQPRGWRMHLQTADNNINPLRVPEEFLKVYHGNEVISTLGHEYDPLLPILMTDKAGLIDRINMNHMGAFFNKRYKLTITSTNIKSDYPYHNEVLVPAEIATATGSDTLYVYAKTSDGDGLLCHNGVITVEADSANITAVHDIYITHTALTNTQLATGKEFDGYNLLETVVGHGVSINVPNVFDGGLNDTRITSVRFDYVEDREYCINGGPFRYSYSDLRNIYYVTVRHPIMHGIETYLNEGMGPKIASLTNYRLDIPFVFSTQYMTLAQLILCAATPYIVKSRLNSMKDVLYYQENIGSYPFSGLVAISEAPIKNFSNFGFASYDEPIEVRQMSQIQAIRWSMPEFFWKVDAACYVSPWYTCENNLEDDGTVDLDASCMAFPSIRSGVRLANLNSFYAVTEKDVRLSYDMLHPGYLDIFDAVDRFAYKYGRTGDGQIAFTIPSELTPPTILDFLSCPRELGVIAECPQGYLTPDDSSFAISDSASGLTTSYRIKVWANTDAVSNPSILDTGDVNISRAANYTQKWSQVKAGANTSLFGLVFGLNDDDYEEVSPFVELGNGLQIVDYTVATKQRSLWTRLQTLPFVISPFDHSSSADADVQDIYDVAYMFGLAGFRASDYRESVYNREKEVINQGMLFVSDPWIDASPLVNAGASATGLKVSKGYELK